MIQKQNCLYGEHKNLWENIIIHSFYNVYNKLDDKKDMIKKQLLMQIKNIIVNDLSKVKMLKVKLEKENEPSLVFYFSEKLFDKDILENCYTMLQDILYDNEYKISLEFEYK
jgi:hypothetical protein